MDSVTHVATGLLLSQFFQFPSRWVAALAALAFSVLNDLDYLLRFWDKMTYLRHHRGLTHSLLAIPLLTLMGAGTGAALVGREWFWPLILLGAAILTSHLIVDLATAYGIQLFHPFSRRKLTLDWLFVVDFRLTGLLVLAVLTALVFPSWSKTAALTGLAAALAYMLLCGLYHHRALHLAREVFEKTGPAPAEAAALPQPFSPRRWLLISSSPDGVLQSFVQLPGNPFGLWTPKASKVALVEVAPGEVARAPLSPFHPPEGLVVWRWPHCPPNSQKYCRATHLLLSDFRKFARFPHLGLACEEGEEVILEWLDLRFSVPGYRITYRLKVALDLHGNLQDWRLGPFVVVRK